MEAGNEMDLLVKEKVFDQHPRPGIFFHAPEYSTHIGYAWEVVEKLRSDGHLVLINCYEDAYEVIIDPEGAQDETNAAESDSAPLAICLAALKVLGVEVA